MPTTTRPGTDTAGLALLAGAILGFVLVKEVFRSIGEVAILAGARHTSRTEKAFSLALLLRAVQRIGGGALRSAGA